MQQMVEEGHLRRVVEVVVGAVKVVTLHDGDLVTQRVEPDAQRVVVPAGGLDETKVDSGRAGTENMGQQDGRKEGQKCEDGREAAVRVLLLRRALWVGHKAVFATGLAREDQVGERTGLEEAVPVSAGRLGRTQAGACHAAAGAHSRTLSFLSSHAHVRASPFRDPFRTFPSQTFPFRTCPARRASAVLHI